MFDQANSPRPVRLSSKTREFAKESLLGKYGDFAMQSYALSLEKSELEGLGPYARYDLAVRRIATDAPLRVLDFEYVSGSATLGGAIDHIIPVLCDGKAVYPSVSHLTLGFSRVLTLGINGIEKEIEREREAAKDGREAEFLDSLINTVNSFKIYHLRYLNALDGYPERQRLLSRVPLEPCKSFKEAVQSLWFTFSFVRLCGNWPGIGRIDQMLGPYLEADLLSGDITLGEAREFFSHFFIKGCEWIRSNVAPGSGDAQHYQNIVLSGTDENGIDTTNGVTYLVLDIIEELGISDFPVTVRLSDKTPERLYRRIAEVVRLGGGIIAVYGEETVKKAMLKAGCDPKDVHGFANDGCWEVQIPGRTCFSYMPFDGLRILLSETLKIGKGRVSFGSYDELFSAYMKDLDRSVTAMIEGADRSRTVYKDGGFEYVDILPCSVISLFEEDCIKNRRGYHGGGTKYSILSPHIGGAPDVANSLHAIKKLVFDDGVISLDGLLSALEANWEGYEALRSYAMNRINYYGSDDDEADSVYKSVLDGFADICAGYGCKGYIRYPSGVSTFGRQIEWAPYREATPFGAKKGEILSGNASPTPGTDTEGATAAVRSYCKADLTKQGTGAALDIRLHTSAVKGEEGIEALSSLMRGFVSLGGFFMQIDVADAAVLREAQRDPEKYRTLSVRVSGWNARFVTLCKEWQDMIIGQAENKR